MKSPNGAERGVAGDQISPEGAPVNSAGQTTLRPRRSWPDLVAGGAPSGGNQWERGAETHRGQ